MSRLKKNVADLTISDLERYPVWEFTNNDEDELAVTPVKALPVTHGDGRVIGTEVQLADGSREWALLANISPSNPRSTLHFLCLTILRDGRRFSLARYHDVDKEQHGTEALASFLKSSVEAVFPISYDVRRVCSGDVAALTGTIEAEPSEKLTEDELMELVFS